MRKTKKQLATLGLAVMLASSMSMTAFAGQWQQDATGWWYQNDDGTYFNGGWQWIEGKCYYFTPEGYCLTNTTTPDGYTVDGSGAWVVNGVIQEQSITEAVTSLPSGYNENGLSNLAIDILEHTRAENAAKYGEVDVQEMAGEYLVYYKDMNFIVNYYYGKMDEKPSYVHAKATDIFRDAPMTGNAYDDKDALRVDGYSVTTNGGYVAISCGKYLVDIRSDQKTAKIYIKFDYK